MERRRIAVTGLGLVTPFGLGAEPLWQGLLAGRSAVRPAAGFSAAGLPTDHVGEIPPFDASPFLSRKQLATWSRASQVATVAARLAWEDAGLGRLDTGADEVEPRRVGVALGTGFGCTLELEEVYAGWQSAGARAIKPITIPRGMPNAPASHIAIALRAEGPVQTVSTACSSGAVALALALDQLRAGRLDVALAGGVEVALNASTFAGWCALGIVARRNAPSACRPFSVDRDGLVLADGAALLVLEDEARARRRGARIYARLAGAGLANDAHGIVEPEAAGEAAAIRGALEDAGLTPGDIGYVNAHGTGTRANDSTETRALKEALGERAAAIPVSSLKGHLGHTLGAAGAIEAAVTALALTHQILPPTLNFTPGDPACDLDYVPTPRPWSFAHALSNSFGFGGQNAVLALSRNGS
ncbi:MAG TPA: beta-ketoacyl-[acyl-carrier-protein] synthase family protein [Thermoanaerobaculia bacterium]|nr:beta-ketoacyl-[acyl-carrier-protein] synthase family protein [Thermoanaerobaculia bacterium]